MNANSERHLLIELCITNGITGDELTGTRNIDSCVVGKET